MKTIEQLKEEEYDLSSKLSENLYQQKELNVKVNIENHAIKTH